MIKVLFFAQLREQVQCSEIELTLAAPLPVSQVVTELKSENDLFATHLDNDKLLMAVNQEMVKPDALVNDGDEVAFFPPVTGG